MNSDIIICAPYVLQLPSSRAARFTPSPIIVKSIRLEEPILPVTTLSVFTPTPIPTGILSVFKRSAFHLRSSEIIAMDDLTAASAASSLGRGTPKPAIIASPINLSSIPPASVIQATIISKYSFSMDTVS